MLSGSPSPEPYGFGFTAAGLEVSTCQKLARIYDECRDWKTVRQIVLETNALQQERATSLKRAESEYRKRLELLTDAQIQLLAETPDELTARLLSLLAVFKRYTLIFDFCVLTLRPKLLVFDTEIRPSDFENFVEAVEPYRPEIATVTDKTRERLRQRLLQILTQGSLISAGKVPTITPPIVPDEVANAIVEERPFILQGFLVSESEIAVLANA